MTFASTGASSADEYTFPYATCEVPPLTSKKSQWWWPDQPWSAAVNFTILCILGVFVCLARSWESRLFLALLWLFEASHTWAHCSHIAGGTQQGVTHSLACAVNLSLIVLLHRVAGGGKWPGVGVWALWGSLAVIDLWAFFFAGFIWSVLTQMALFFAILFYYYWRLPKWVQRWLMVLLVFSALVYAAVWNEKANCDAMLEFCPWFPWHVIVEGLSLFAMFILGWMFYRF